MSIYTLIILLFLFFSLIPNKVNNNAFQKIAFFILFSLFAFRGDNVGGDTIEYCNFYRGVYDAYGTWKEPDLGLINEPGLSWLCYFLHLFNDGDAFVFLFVTSGISLLPFLYFVKRFSNDKVVPLLLFMVLWGLLSIVMTGLRQVLGVSILLFAYIICFNLKLNKKTRSLLVTLLLIFSLSFHSTILIAFVLYIFSFIIKIRKNIAIISIIGTYIIGASLTTFIPVVYIIIGQLFEGSELFFRFEQYFTIKYDLATSALGIQQLLTSFLVCMYCYSLDELKEEYEENLCEKKNKYYLLTKKFQINCLILGCVFYNLFAPFPNCGRFLYPLFIVGITSSIPHKTIHNNNVFKFLFYITLIILSIHEIYTMVLGQADRTSDYYVANQMFPYLFIWE